jgi:peroxidase
MDRRQSQSARRQPTGYPAANSASYLGSRALRPARVHFKPCFEMLEMRSMFSIAPLDYSITGAGNNLTNANLGAAGQALLQPAGTNYGDGASTITTSTASGQTLPSAREISNLLGSQSGDVLDGRNLSAMSYAFGQFVDHDLDLTPTSDVSDPIAVPSGDPQFDPNGTGTATLPFTRSVTLSGTGTSSSNPLNQPTLVTSYLDLSQIYGSDAVTAAALRTFKGGQLKEGTNGSLPQDVPTVAVANLDGSTQYNPTLDMSGDVRANENDDLMAIEILFVREHNREAASLQKEHPGWTDQQLYEGARQVTIAEYQSIVFNEYLPSLLGSGAVASYTGYDPTVNPSIANVFSEAAFRFGHSQLDDDIQFQSNNGSNLAFTYTATDGVTQVQVNTPADIAAGDTGMPLLDGFFNAGIMSVPGVEGGILKYLASDVSQNVDLKMVDSVRNILFGAPGSGAGGEDLFALDVERGRDVGLPTLNGTRVAYGLTPYTSFAQITADPTVQADLQTLYGSVDNVELFVGGLAEDHAAGSSVGPTFGAIIADQFERVRDGDRLWYQNIFSGSDLRAIQNTTLADLIRANTSTTNVQGNVFFFQTSISGQVSVDGNGPHDSHRSGAAGVLVELEDSSGNVVASTETSSDGSFTFGDVGLGNFRVTIAPTGQFAKSALSTPVSVTRGGAITSIDFDLHDGLQSPGGPRNGFGDPPPHDGHGH